MYNDIYNAAFKDELEKIAKLPGSGMVKRKARKLYTTDEQDVEIGIKKLFNLPINSKKYIHNRRMESHQEGRK